MSISITRTTVVRAHHELDATSCRQLDRIVTDLIDNQGHTDLILDLSQVGHIDHSLRAVLERAQTRTDALGGTLEIRTPPEPTNELLKIVEEIPAFAPIEPANKHPQPEASPAAQRPTG
jgi:anti-anti-sigma factor